MANNSGFGNAVLASENHRKADGDTNHTAELLDGPGRWELDNLSNNAVASSGLRCHQALGMVTTAGSG